MDLRHDALPWNEQIWAKIHADLAHTLAASRRARAPLEVFHVDDSQQTVMADRISDDGGYASAETESMSVVELSVPFEIRQSQIFNEGNNFFALDRIIAAAHQMGYAEDALILRPNAALPNGSNANISTPAIGWHGLYEERGYRNVGPVYDFGTRELGLRVFDAVIKARSFLRQWHRYEPFALILSNELEGQISSTVPTTNSLNTPIERMRPLVTAGIHTSPILQNNTGIVVSCSRSWMDIAQAMEPAIQFLRIGDNGEYHLRLVERFAFRLKDQAARCAIELR